jgi:hypothetical protein
MAWLATLSDPIIPDQDMLFFEKNHASSSFYMGNIQLMEVQKTTALATSTNHYKIIAYTKHYVNVSGFS